MTGPEMTAAEDAELRGVIAKVPAHVLVAFVLALRRHITGAITFSASMAELEQFIANRNERT